MLAGTNVEVKLHKVNRLAEIMEQALQQQMRIVQQQTALNTLCFAAMFQKPVSSPSSQATGGHRRDAVLYYEGINSTHSVFASCRMAQQMYGIEKFSELVGRV